jgi:hypothetical protein
MGPASLLLRAPFAGVTRALGGSEIWQYRAGAVACVLPLAALGAHAGDLMRRRGSRPALGNAVAVLTVANPASWQALQSGHPEELLGAAACVFALLATLGGRATAAGLALGAAVATKQWALVAVAPVLLATPSGRARGVVAAWAVGVAGVFYGAMLLGDPSAFLRVNTHAATLPAVGSMNLAYLSLRGAGAVHLAAGSTTYALPSWLGPLLHPAVVIASIPPAVWLWRRRPSAPASSWLLLLAFVLLVRCAFDPGDWTYYHVPMLAALAVSQATQPRPQLSLMIVATAGLAVVTNIEPGIAQGVLYAALALGVLAAMLQKLYRPDSVVVCAPERWDVRTHHSTAV